MPGYQQIIAHNRLGGDSNRRFSHTPGLLLKGIHKIEMAINPTENKRVAPANSPKFKSIFCLKKNIDRESYPLQIPVGVTF